MHVFLVLLQIVTDSVYTVSARLTNGIRSKCQKFREKTTNHRQFLRLTCAAKSFPIWRTKRMEKIKKPRKKRK